MKWFRLATALGLARLLLSASAVHAAPITPEDLVAEHQRYVNMTRNYIAKVVCTDEDGRCLARLTIASEPASRSELILTEPLRSARRRTLTRVRAGRPEVVQVSGVGRWVPDASPGPFGDGSYQLVRPGETAREALARINKICTIRGVLVDPKRHPGQAALSLRWRPSYLREQVKTWFGTSRDTTSRLDLDALPAGVALWYNRSDGSLGGVDVIRDEGGRPTLLYSSVIEYLETNLPEPRFQSIWRGMEGKVFLRPGSFRRFDDLLRAWNPIQHPTSPTSFLLMNAIPIVVVLIYLRYRKQISI